MRSPVRPSPPAGDRVASRNPRARATARTTNATGTCTTAIGSCAVRMGNADRRSILLITRSPSKGRGSRAGAPPKRRLSLDLYHKSHLQSRVLCPSGAGQFIQSCQSIGSRPSPSSSCRASIERQRMAISARWRLRIWAASRGHISLSVTGMGRQWGTGIAEHRGAPPGSSSPFHHSRCLTAGSLSMARSSQLAICSPSISRVRLSAT